MSTISQPLPDRIALVSRRRVIREELIVVDAAGDEWTHVSRDQVEAWKAEHENQLEELRLLLAVAQAQVSAEKVKSLQATRATREQIASLEAAGNAVEQKATRLMDDLQRERQKRQRSQEREAALRGQIAALERRARRRRRAPEKVGEQLDRKPAP